MGYKVLVRFEDTDGRVYRVNERYQKDIDEERRTVLTTCANKYGKPFLEVLGGNESPDNPINNKNDKDIKYYQNKTVKELKDIADDKDIKYNQKVRKDDLIKFIMAKENKEVG